jgi:hypothetical protein
LALVVPVGLRRIAEGGLLDAAALLVLLLFEACRPVELKLSVPNGDVK